MLRKILRHFSKNLVFKLKIFFFFEELILSCRYQLEDKLILMISELWPKLITLLNAMIFWKKIAIHHDGKLLSGETEGWITEDRIKKNFSQKIEKSLT